MKIIKLKINNVGGIEAFELDPNGEHVVIGGKNGAGKSTVLNAIAGALGGAKERLPAKVRRGAERGEVVIDLGEIVVRWGTDAAGRDTLNVESADGASYKRPQEKLAALFGARTFDPLKFFDAPPAEQARQLATLAGIDLVDYERRYNSTFEERKLVGRQWKTAQGALDSMAPPAADLPTEHMDTVPLLQAISEAGRKAAEREAALEKIADCERRAEESARASVELRESTASVVGRIEAECRREIDEAQREVDAALARLEAAKKRAVHRVQMEKDDIERRVEEHWKNARSFGDRAVSLKADLGPEPPPTDELQAKLRDAQSINRAIDEAARYREQAAQVEELKAERIAMTAKLETIKAEQAGAVAAAPIPVKGLGLEGGQVTFTGLPMQNLSSSERLRVSVGLQIAVNPEIRIMLIDRWNDLDDDSRAIVREMADEANCQILTTVVGVKDEDITVTIREGRVSEPSSEDAR